MKKIIYNINYYICRIKKFYICFLTRQHDWHNKERTNKKGKTKVYQRECFLCLKKQNKQNGKWVDV